MNNLIITNTPELPEDYSIAVIDGKEVTTLRHFYEVLAKTLEFPDYFGFNLDSLDELLNDLSWIENEKIAIQIINSESFLASERNQDKILTLLDLLDATCEDWRWMEPQEGVSEDDEDYIPKKELVFVFSESPRMIELLKHFE
jgi:RNAse (barnase) inhibitor barstar